MLLIVLVVIALLTLASYTFCQRMLQHRRGARVYGRKLQTLALVDSGQALIGLLLRRDWESRQRIGGIYDNPDRLRGVLVLDNALPVTRGRFTVIAPRMEDDAVGDVRYGVEDESARLNINALLAADKRKSGNGRTMLMALPGMTEDIADAILDWIDPDDQPRRSGAEADYYAGLDPPYVPRNGPLESVDELLLVRGVTAELLYGADWNHNGLLDPTEADAGTAVAAGTLDGDLVRGWAGYLTCYSAEKNLRPDGTRKIDLNQTDLKKLHGELTKTFDKKTADFVVAWRQYGPSTSGRQGRAGRRRNGGQGGGQSGGRRGGRGGGKRGKSGRQAGRSTTGGSSGGGGSSKGGQASSTGSKRQPVRRLQAAGGRGSSGAAGKIDLNKPGTHKLETVLDLIGAQVEIPAANPRQPAKRLKSPLAATSGAMAKYLTQWVETTTTNPAKVIRGRININQAPRVVLAGIPGLAPELIDHILASRDMEVPLASPDRRRATWLLTEGILSLAAMKRIYPFVTAGGDIYRAQVVGYFDAEGPTSRVELLLDATTDPPRLLFWRDLSALGRGYAMDVLGQD